MNFRYKDYSAENIIYRYP